MATHPDDAELSAAVLLGAGATILCLTHRDDDRGPEATRAAKTTGTELLWGGLADGAVTDGPALVALIEGLVDRVAPDVLAGPPACDEHADHAATARAVAAATRRARLTVLEYETPSTPPGWAPDTFLPLSAAAADLRERALAEHTSQAARPYCQPDALRARARYWGQRAGLVAAEAYRTVRRTVL